MEEFNNSNNKIENSLIKKAFNTLLGKEIDDIESFYESVIDDSKINKNTEKDKKYIIEDEEWDDLMEIFGDNFIDYQLHSRIDELRQKILEKKEDREKKIELLIIDNFIDKIRYWFYKKNGVEYNAINNNEDILRKVKDELFIEDFKNEKQKRENDEIEEKRIKERKKIKQKILKKEYFKEISEDLKYFDEYLEKESIDELIIGYYVSYYYDDDIDFLTTNDIDFLIEEFDEREQRKKHEKDQQMEITDNEIQYIYKLSGKYEFDDKHTSIKELLKKITDLKKEAVIGIQKKELENEIQFIEKFIKKIEYWYFS